MKKIFITTLLAGLSIGLVTAGLFKHSDYYQISRADNGITFNESEHYYVGQDYSGFITITNPLIETLYVECSPSSVASFNEATNTLSCLAYGSTTITVYNLDTFDEIDTLDITVEFEDKINGDRNEFYVMDQGTLTITNPNPALYSYVNGGGSVEDGSSRKIVTLSNLRLSGSNLLLDYEFENQTSDYLYFDIIFDEDGTFNNYVEKRYYFKAIELPEDLEEAINFGESFFDVCGDVNASKWADIKDDYDVLAELYPGAVTYLRSATYELSGSGNETVVTKTGSTHYLLAFYMSQYDYMVTTYSLTNFIGRSISPSSVIRVSNQNTNNALIVIAIVSTASLLLLGGYLFIKKKKEN